MDRNRLADEDDESQFSDWTPLIENKSHIGYDQLVAEAAHIAHNLRTKILPKSDKVAIHIPNSAQYVALIWGMIAAEVTICLCSTRLPVPQMHDQLKHIGCRYLITDSVHAADVPGIRVLDANRLFDRTKAETRPLDMRFSHSSTILFTSGSTGIPKAAQLRHSRLMASASEASVNMPFGKGDRWLLALPLYHIGGYSILWRGFWGTGTVVIPEGGLTLLQAIEKYSITHVSLVPTQLSKLVAEMKASGASLPRIKAVLVGGSSMSFDLITQAVDLGLPLFTTYGLTEMGSQVTTTAHGDGPDKLRTSGRLLKGRAMKIADDEEILVCGPSLFDGYVGPEGVNLPLDRYGWFHTGDMGRLDEDGYLTVTGRKDNMFISGGENIYPEEIEMVIKDFHGVLEAVVVPVRSEKWGERPIAFIQLADSMSLDRSKLQDHVSSRLPKFKFPDQIFPWPTDSLVGLKPSRPFFRELAEKLMRR